MKIWLSKNAEVSVSEQLATQIKIGIASGDLPVGERLPSTREMARRFNLHANTVGAVYQKLSAEGLLKFKRGSGFYVCRAEHEDAGEARAELDKLIRDFLRVARDCGFNETEIRNRLKFRLSAAAPEHFLVVESDLALREILIEEIQNSVNFPVAGVSLEEFDRDYQESNSIIAAMFDEKSKIENLIAPNKSVVYLTARSVSDSMRGVERPAANDLIAVVSGWRKFLDFAKTVLIAARVDSESLMIRSTAESDWRKCLPAASMIICDSLTAKSLPFDDRIKVFSLISDASLSKLQVQIRR